MEEKKSEDLEKIKQEIEKIEKDENIYKTSELVFVLHIIAGFLLLTIELGIIFGILWVFT
jgi:MFS superfamily sulfate permease-like transporter